jgi:hypothetical protein
MPRASTGEHRHAALVTAAPLQRSFAEAFSHKLVIEPMTYLDELAATIREYAPAGVTPTRGLDSLFRMYAVLALAKGEKVTPEDVHNAWAAWTQESGEHHREVRPFSELDDATQAEDSPYAEAIHLAVREFLALPR